MVFPSLAFNFEPGLISQASAFVVLAFSYLLHRFKKIMLMILLVFSLFLVFQTKVFAFMAVSPYNQNTCSGYAGCYNNQNYWGRPWGYNPSIYFYPQLQYHSIWGLQPYYFYPHTPSPYRPYDCPFCNQYQNPGFNPGNNHPPGVAS
jgi:hypothetical protein